MNTLQTSFTALQSEMITIRSNVRSVAVMNRNSIGRLNNDITRFMSISSIETLSLFAAFLGYDLNKTANLIMSADFGTFSKYFA